MRLVPSILLAMAILAGRVEAIPLSAAVTDSMLAEARVAHFSGNSERAVPVFRAYLDSHPQDLSVRRDLANALAWTGKPDDAIPLYDDLLVSEPNDPTLLKARANALRWMGRNEEALADYSNLREITPNDLEVSRWIDELKRQVDPYGLGDGDFFHDSSRITTIRWGTRVQVAGTVLRSTNLSVGAESISDGDRSATGHWITAGWKKVVAGGHSIEGEAGGILFDGGDAEPRLFVRVHARPNPRTSVGLACGYRDRAYELKSYKAHEKRIAGFHAALSSYWLVTERAGLWSQVRGGRLDDGNAWRSADLSVDRAFPYGLRVAAAAYGIDYDDHEASYYAPEKEWSYYGRLGEGFAIGGVAKVDLSGWVGKVGNRYGQGGLVGTQLSFSTRIARSWEVRGSAEYTESRRETNYIWRVFHLELRWSR